MKKSYKNTPIKKTTETSELYRGSNFLKKRVNSFVPQKNVSNMMINRAVKQMKMPGRPKVPMSSSKKMSNVPMEIDKNIKNISGSDFFSFQDEKEVEKKKRENMIKENQYIQSLHKRMIETAPELVIEDLEFSLYSQKDILKMTYVSVINPVINIPPLRGSVNDQRMGSTDNKTPCETCTLVTDCPGHYGRIDFNRPILHPLYRKQIVQVLTCVCHNCGSLLVKRKFMEKQGLFKYHDLKRLEMLEKISNGFECQKVHNEVDIKTKKCPRNPIFDMNQVLETGRLHYHWPENKNSTDIMPLVDEKGRTGALTILKQISEEDLELMGFSGGAHPKNFIMKRMIVIPPRARPPSYVGNTIHSDHLTTMYADIVKKNNLLLNLTGTDLIKQENILAWTVAHFMDNKDSLYGQGGQSKPYTGIKQRIQGKNKILRGNMMGKRVDFSARTVISPNPSLKFGQVAIPEAIAKGLTTPKTVTVNNIKTLTKLLKAGKINSVIVGTGDYKGQTVVTDYILKRGGLSIGDIANVQIQNGDYVIINRQPSLSGYSMMSCEVVIWKNLSIGLHLAYTTPLNADFDGDEMNLHFVQTEEAKDEAVGLYNVANCLMSTHNNRNVMGVVYDALTGAYLMTYRPDVMIDIDEYFNIVGMLSTDTENFQLVTVEDVEMFSLHARLKEFGIHPQSGRGVFSALLPKNFEYQQGDVLIHKGVLIKGAITKAQIGVSSGSIIQAIVNTDEKDGGGTIRARDFLSDIYFMMNRWLTTVGFSIGMDSCRLPKEPIKIESELLEKIENDIIPALKMTKTSEVVQSIADIYKNLEKSKIKLDLEGEINLIKILLPFRIDKEKSRNPEIEKNIQKAYMYVDNLGGGDINNKIEEERRESKIRKELDQTGSLGTRLLEKYLPEYNPFNIMSMSGSKGSSVNTSNVTGILGQQYHSGERPVKTMTGGRRTLPYFSVDDITPNTRGFIENSFGSGLNVAETISHSISSREGLLDTATKTSETGNIHHRMGKMTEDIKIFNDGTVRNSSGKIYDQCYVFNPSKMERVKTKMGEFPSFINIKREVEKLNTKYNVKKKLPLIILPYEYKFIFNESTVYIIDVGNKRIKIKYEDKDITETINIDDINSPLQKLNIIKPRINNNTPITVLLPIGSRISIKNDNELIKASVNYYTPFEMFISFESQEFKVKNNDLLHKINNTNKFSSNDSISIYLVSTILLNNNNKSITVNLPMGTRLILIDNNIKYLNPKSNFQIGDKIKIILTANVTSVSPKSVSVILPPQQAYIDIKNVNFDTALNQPIESSYTLI